MNKNYKDRSPGIFLVLVVSILILSLMGASLIMGSLIYQFSRGERIFSEGEDPRDSDQLVIHQSDDQTDPEEDGSVVSLAVMPSTVLVLRGEEQYLGLVVGSNGYVLTGPQPEGASLEVQVGGRTYPVEALVADPVTGLSLLKISADSLRTAVFGDSDSLYQGCRIYKIDLVAGEPSVFEGIVSSIHQLDLSGTEVPAVAADIPPSSSGFCLLVDSDGRVVAAGSCLEDTPCTGCYAGNYVLEFAAFAGAD